MPKHPSPSGPRNTPSSCPSSNPRAASPGRAATPEPPREQGSPGNAGHPRKRQTTKTGIKSAFSSGAGIDLLKDAKFTELLPRIQEIGDKLTRGEAKNPALRLNPPHLLPYCLPLPSCHRFRPASHRLIPVTPILSPLPCSSPSCRRFPSRRSLSRSRPISDSVPLFPVLHPSCLRFQPSLFPISLPCPGPTHLLSLPTAAPPLPHFPPQSFTAPGLSFAPGLPAPRPAILFPTATNCPSFLRAHKRAHKKRTAGAMPAVLSIYRRTAAPFLRAGITPRPSLPWQPSWRSSPRQPPWRSSARPDLRCHPASSSRPKR